MTNMFRNTHLPTICIFELSAQSSPVKSNTTMDWRRFDGAGVMAGFIFFDPESLLLSVWETIFFTEC